MVDLENFGISISNIELNKDKCKQNFIDNFTF